jgi:hypothetical protein
MWLLPPLKVISISTENNIVVVFSAQPSKESIKKAFSLSEEGQTVSGVFSFDDKSVVFIPLNGLRANHEYNITISTVAEDKKGNSLLRDFEYNFFTKQDIEIPHILGINPANESNLTLVPETISVAFSKTMDTVSFERALSISPSIPHVLEWNTEHTAVDIIPVKPLVKGTRYTITINTTLTDTYRNALLTTFRSTFLYGLDRNPPENTITWETTSGDTSGLLTPNIINQDIPSDSDFIIVFDKSVQIDAIAGFIEINPPIGITVIPDIISGNSARITLNHKPEWNKNYTLKLKRGITDTFGNKTETDILFPLVFNTEKHRPVTFAGGVLKNNLEYKFINSTTDFSSITLDVIHFNPGNLTAVSTELYYAFRISGEAESISLVSAMQAISISTRNACAYISIRTMNFLTPDAPNNEYNTIYALLDDNGEGKLIILKMGIDIENTENRGLIIFSIRNDISDNLGNTMVDSINLTLNKQ